MKLAGWIWPEIHPSPGLLLESVDGQLDRQAEARVRTHLIHCVACRSRLEELLEGIRFFDRQIAPKESQVSVDEWAKGVGPSQENGELVFEGQEQRPSLVAYARMQSELSVYVGHHFARQLLERCDRPAIRRDRIKSIIQPVIAELFGEPTGVAVVDSMIRIWHRTQTEGN